MYLIDTGAHVSVSICSRLSARPPAYLPLPFPPFCISCQFRFRARTQQDSNNSRDFCYFFRNFVRKSKSFLIAFPPPPPPPPPRKPFRMERVPFPSYCSWCRGTTALTFRSGYSPVSGPLFIRRVLSGGPLLIVTNIWPALSQRRSVAESHFCVLRHFSFG